MAKKILVVDDDELVLIAIQELLNPLGFSVTTTSNGPGALEKVSGDRFDLVILDVIMPEMDGFETCRRLKESAATNDIPVIFLTARTETSDIVQGFEVGAVDYVAKPFNAHELLARVSTHLTLDQLRRSLAGKNAELARAHELVRRAFGRYVSEEVAASILQSPEGLELGGEEREVTILMSDLRGFTALAARLSPHEVIEFLNLYLEAMVDVISRYEGTIDEIIGDAILVIFGAPVVCDDHAAKAVACGLSMQLAMTDVNQRLTAKGAAELEMGIGIHTGRVIVGNIGSLRRTKYAAVGSNVNLAGRIESFTTGGQLLISESTRERITSPLRAGLRQVSRRPAAGGAKADQAARLRHRAGEEGRDGRVRRLRHAVARGFLRHRVSRGVALRQAGHRLFRRRRPSRDRRRPRRIARAVRRLAHAGRVHRRPVLGSRHGGGDGRARP